MATTIADLAGVKGSADGPPSDARLQLPRRIAVDQNNNFFITDDLNFTVWKMTASWQVTTLAGIPGQFGFQDEIGAAARFAIVGAIAVDSADIIYMADRMSFPPSHIRIGAPAD